MKKALSIVSLVLACSSTSIAIPDFVQQAYIKASNSAIGDRFGYAVALSGDTLVIGARYEDSAATGVNGNQSDNGAEESGAAYVFVRSNGEWAQQAYLKASNTDAGDHFGVSVAVSGDTLVVGAIREDSNAMGVDGEQNNDSAIDAGAAYIFVRNAGVWSQQAYLKATNSGAGDEFGWSVAISGDSVAIGAHQEDSSATDVGGDGSDNSAPQSGAAYLFTRSGDTWSPQAYVKASNTDGGDLFGGAVALAGGRLIVGAWKEDSSATGVGGDEGDDAFTDAGAAYLFVRSGATWSQEAYLKASNSASFDYFGYAVGLTTDRALVSAYAEDSSATGVDGDESNNSADDSGAAYVFVRSGANWNQEAYLKASNTESSDFFGRSVALSDQTALIGANGEDSSATGVDGDGSDNSAGESGAAYAFVRSGTQWSPLAYVKASNSAAGDQFGKSAAVSSKRGVLGAIWEDGGDTGVNGDENDNGASDAGAAYLFEDLNAPLFSDSFEGG